MPAFIQNIDEAIQIAIQTNWHVPFIDKFLGTYSTIGNHGEIWIAILLLMVCFKKTRKPALISAVVLAVAFLTNDFFLKKLIERPRPYNVLTQFEPVIPRLKSFSFPSGHSNSSFAAAVSIFWTESVYVQWDNAKNWFLCHRLGICSLVLAVLMAFSRVYLFMHWPSDVIAGALWGVLCALVAMFVMKKVDAARAKKLTEK